MCVNYVTSFYAVPEIVRFPESLQVMEGERVVFQVEVTGAPQPRLRWYHDGEEVVGDYSKKLSEDGSLTMPSAETKHSGVYQLVAVNSAGRVEREVKLMVEREDEDSDMNGSQPQMMATNTALSIAEFGNHVEQCHVGQNQAFKDQYQVYHTTLNECPPARLHTLFDSGIV